jgi:tetratricopeptide (TPR) repeat protein
MVPLIEAVYHTCRAGDYDEALALYWQRIHRERNVLLQQLGAYETGLALMLEFFPKGDTSQEPYVSSTRFKKSILNIVGFCLLQLGRQREAVPFFERSIAMDLSMGDWSIACANYQNIADLHADLGNLSASADASRQALDLARRARDKPAEVESLACQAWAAHLLGDLKTSSALFQQAEVLLREINPQRHYLYGMRGLQHADHLWRVGEVNYARQIVEANLRLVLVHRWANDEILCHRILGDLDADANEHQSAQHHYDEALKIARSSSRWALIEALLAQGRWATRRREVEAAYRYLDEALSYAVAGGYRIYEVDISIALAWAYFTAHDAASARAQVDRAQHHSAEMGYHWGKVDAVEVLAALDGGS